MSWLLRNGEVLASCTRIETGRFPRVPVGELVGAQVLRAQPLCFAGSSGADIAVLDQGQSVLSVASCRRWRPIVTSAAGVTLIVAKRGTFSRWELSVGDMLEVR